MKGRFALAVHGGAGREAAELDDERRRAYEAGLATALSAGEQILANDGSALDAVEQAIRVLEDDPHFNAGRGSVFNHVGHHELDASIMDGRTRRAGAVASVRTVRYPISLARRVMTDSPHVLLMGDGAEHFADQFSRDRVSHDLAIERVANEFFGTDLRRAQWQASLERDRTTDDGYRGTVGCVALDRHGNLAAGTSTGGVTGKKWGRVGDSPIIGAGTYADNATCAVSCTGTGEYFIRDSVAFHVAALMQYRQMPLDDAVKYLLEQVLEPNVGGLIALDASGNLSIRFNTPGMSRASLDGDGKRVVAVGR